MSDQVLSPLEIEMLIHFRCYFDPFPNLQCIAPQGALRKLIDMDLITVGSGGREYVTTERGRLHVQQLCSLRIPQATWIGHDGTVIR